MTSAAPAGSLAVLRRRLGVEGRSGLAGGRTARPTFGTGSAPNVTPDRRRVRHGVRDTLVLMAFSAGASLVVALTLLFAVRVLATVGN